MIFPMKLQLTAISLRESFFTLCRYMLESCCTFDMIPGLVFFTVYKPCVISTLLYYSEFWTIHNPHNNGSFGCSIWGTFVGSSKIDGWTMSSRELVSHPCSHVYVNASLKCHPSSILYPPAPLLWGVRKRGRMTFQTTSTFPFRKRSAPL